MSRDTSRDYYTEEDDKKMIEIMRDWAPRRRAAIEANDLHSAPIPDFVGVKVKEIATHASRGSKWINAPFRDDMVDHAVCETLRYIHGFDPDKIGERSNRVNFFSYVTSAVKNYFGHHTESEAELQYFKDHAFLTSFANDLNGDETVVDTGGNSPDVSDNTDIGRDISNRASSYEQRVAERKEKSKQKREAKQQPKEKPKSRMWQHFNKK